MLFSNGIGLDSASSKGSTNPKYILLDIIEETLS